MSAMKLSPIQMLPPPWSHGTRTSTTCSTEGVTSGKRLAVLRSLIVTIMQSKKAKQNKTTEAGCKQARESLSNKMLPVTENKEKQMQGTYNM